RLAVRRERQGMNPLGVTGQRGLEAKRGCVPQFHFPGPAELGMRASLFSAMITAATGQGQAVRGIDHRINTTLMSEDITFLLASRNVPSAESEIPAATSQRSAVRRKADSGDPVIVLAESHALLTAGQVPHFRRAL